MGRINVLEGVTRRTVAIFENGTVYAGDTTWGRVLGYYGDGEIKDASRRVVAKYSSGTAYALDSIGGNLWSNGAALCNCSGDSIYEGGNSWNRTLGFWAGDCEGACAAAVLYFGLCSEQVNIEDTPRSTGVYIPQTGDSGIVWGVVILIAICLIGTWGFWCTDSGRQFLFGRPECALTVLACVFSAIFGIIKIKKECGMERWISRVEYALPWYSIALVFSWIISMISGLILGDMSWGYFLLSFLAIPLLVVCAGMPIFLAQCIVLIFVKGDN